MKATGASSQYGPIASGGPGHRGARGADRGLCRRVAGQNWRVGRRGAFAPPVRALLGCLVVVGAPAEHGALPVSEHALPTRVGRASVAAGVRAPVVGGAGGVASEGEVVGRVLTAGRRRERGRHAVLRTRARGRRARERTGVTRARGRASARARRGAAAASVDSASVERRSDCRTPRRSARSWTSERRPSCARAPCDAIAADVGRPAAVGVGVSLRETVRALHVALHVRAGVTRCRVALARVVSRRIDRRDVSRVVRRSLENGLHPLALEREQHVEVPRQHADLELRVPLAESRPT